MKTLICHPTGNANVRAATLGFLNRGILAGFQTSIATFPSSPLKSLSQLPPLSELERRSFDPSLESYTETWPWFEMGRLIATKLGIFSLTSHETGLFSIDAVFRNFDRKIASRLNKKKMNGLQAIYTYEDGALLSLLKAKELGLKCFYDLPIGYWRSAQNLLKQEKERWPDWVPTLTGFKDSPAKLSRKDQELSLADSIFVASSFTAQTLEDFPGKLAPIKVIPYGFPPIDSARVYNSKRPGQPLKLLFVGGLSQRKGIANLFAAVEAVKDFVELTIVGLKASNNCPALDAALAKHKWIPSLSHSDILKLMKEQDVLVFPSLFEGFGLVISEAMSQGTPVITTDRTAGPDLINNEESGWLIKAGDTDSIINAIENILLKPKTVAEVGKAARNTADKRPWKVYGFELAEAIKSNLK